MVARSEAEERRWAAEPLRQVRERRDADASAHEQRSFHAETESVAERSEDGQPLAAGGADERACPGPDGVDQEAELAGPREAEAHRARQHPPGRAEHEELARVARDEGPPLDAEELYGPMRSVPMTLSRARRMFLLQ